MCAFPTAPCMWATWPRAATRSSRSRSAPSRSPALKEQAPGDRARHRRAPERTAQAARRPDHGRRRPASTWMCAGTVRMKDADRLSLIDLAGRLDLSRLSIHGDVIVERRPPAIIMGRASVVPPAGLVPAGDAARRGGARRPRARRPARRPSAWPISLPVAGPSPCGLRRSRRFMRSSSTRAR